MTYTIGELARRSGLTVRALHHYEKLGLLCASVRTPAGYRLYGDEDVLTLHRILAYQQMGLALKEIAPLLRPDAPPLLELLTRQIRVAESELMRQQNLLAMLKRVARKASVAGPGLSDHLLALMAMRRSYERHFSAADMQKMIEVQEALGDDGVARVKAGWAELVPAFRAEMDRGADPRSPAVQALAQRWIAMGKNIDAGMGRPMPEDPELRRKGRELFARQPELLAGTGLTLELLDFIDAAVLAERSVLKERS